MENLLILLFLIVFSLTCLAQTFRPFKVALGGGYAAPFNEEASGSFISAIEIQYALNDKLGVGLIGESAQMNRGGKGVKGTVYDEKFTTNILGIFLDGYFSTKDVRPFVHAATGWYRLGTIQTVNSASVTTLEAQDVNKFGVTPGIGVEAHRLRLIVEYNILGDLNQSGMIVNAGFAGVRAGYIFGGKRK